MLVFDLDPQDPQYCAKHIMLMQQHFQESSDMGKLYLNYPMIEAYYHMKSIPDPEFNDRTVSLIELKNRKYKERVNKESKGRDYNKYITSKRDLSIIILQNWAKALQITSGYMNCYLSLSASDQRPDFAKLLQIQLDSIQQNQYVKVLCTCVFFILDYNPHLLALSPQDR